MKQIAAAVFRREGKVLLCRRPEKPGDSCAGLWEFPGGKREPGESLEQCLIRECRPIFFYTNALRRRSTFMRSQTGCAQASP